MAPTAITPPLVDNIVVKDLKASANNNANNNANGVAQVTKPSQGPNANGWSSAKPQTLPTPAATAPKSNHFTGFDNFNLKDVLIPQSTGLGMIKKYYQRRTLYQYFALFGVGLWAFHYQTSTPLRVLGLGLLFPGAGFTAIPGISSLLWGILCAVLVPVALFVWFGCGAFIVPIALWIGSAAAAARRAGNADVLMDRAGTIWPILCITLIVLVTNKAKSINLAGWTKKQERNKYLIKAVQEQQMKAAAAPAIGSREVDLNTLRFIQHMVERGLTDIDDFSKNDVIDQFREAAIRYQLYGVVDILSLYMTHFTPRFHGYVAQACRNSIEKSLTKRVLYYWKWESMFGKFKFNDWDPIKEDNIMVTGYLGAAMGLYESATGDDRYHEKDSLDMVIADGKHYKTSYEGLADALESNMYRNPYCLYPCEPNWTYSLCNLTGMASLIISDRILGQNRSEKLKARFERALEEEFTEPDGRILAVRNETTGLTIPGFCGTLSDCINAVLMTAYLPHLAHRNWAMIRKEFIGYDSAGKLYVKDLKGADKIDPCNYRVSDGPIRAYVAMAAAEFGDEKIRKECLEQLDEKYFPVEATPTGSLYNKGLSASSQVISLMARLLRHGDLANATKHGPEPNAMKGPLLEHVPFPDVLVAKAYSADGVKLDLVLHPGKAAGTFELGFESLLPGARYSVGNNASMIADQNGNGKVEVLVNGRTELTVAPA